MLRKLAFAFFGIANGTGAVAQGSLAWSTLISLVAAKGDRPASCWMLRALIHTAFCAEANPGFMDEVRETADPGKRVILVCNMGGNLDPAYAPSKFGMQSRCAAVCTVDVVNIAARLMTNRYHPG